MRKTGLSKRWANGVAVAALGLTLAACEQIDGLDLPFLNQNDTSGTTDNLAPVPVSTGETRDVESPEIFGKTETGLWDGRPSLGGIWVAHPDVTDPERVIIRNEDNGRFVIGALFRRERENPGPPFQVSSDAAEEVGMLAGSPATLNVVALRREEVVITPPVPVTPQFDAPLEDVATDLAPPAAISATPLDAPEAASVTPIAPVAAATATAAATTGAAATVDAIAIAAAAVQTAQAAAAVDVTLPPAVASAPLEALIPEAEAAPLPAPVPVPASAPVTSSLEKPYIQTGIFNLEESANENADTLRAAGMSVSVAQQESQGKTLWRVLVGPAPNAQDRTAILAQVQALGFSDAYFVTN